MPVLRCPYCIEGGKFKVMIGQGGSETWYMCGRCQKKKSAASRQYSHLQFCGCPLHYPTRRFQGVASLTRGCSAQTWEANSAESCVLNVRFISS